MGRPNLVANPNIWVHTCSVDLLHTHLTFGLVAGCPGCEQHILDVSRARFVNAGGRESQDGLQRLQLWYSIRSYTRQELLPAKDKVDTLTLN